MVAGELRRQVNERVDCLAENMGNHEAATRDPDSLIFRSNPWVRPEQACLGACHAALASLASCLA